MAPLNPPSSVQNVADNAENIDDSPRTILAVLKSPDGQDVGPSLQLPVDVSPEQLEMVLNQLLENV